MQTTTLWIINDFLSSGSFNSVIKSLKIARTWKAECQQRWECCNLVGNFFLQFSLFALLLHLEFIFSLIRTSTLCRENINLCVVLKNTIHFNNWKNTAEQCREEEFHFLEAISFMLFSPMLNALQFEAEQFILEQSLLSLRVNDEVDPSNAKGFSFFSLLYVRTHEILFCISSAGTGLLERNVLLKTTAIQCTIPNYHKNVTAALDKSMNYLVHCLLFKKTGDW